MKYGLIGNYITDDGGGSGPIIIKKFDTLRDAMDCVEKNINRMLLMRSQYQSSGKGDFHPINGTIYEIGPNTWSLETKTERIWVTK